MQIVDPQSHLCCVETDAGLVQTVGEKDIESIDFEKRPIELFEEIENINFKATD